MALIICPDCGRKVSDMATSCPECGRPIKGVTIEQPPKTQKSIYEDPDTVEQEQVNQFNPSEIRNDLKSILEYQKWQLILVLAFFIVPYLWLSIAWKSWDETLLYATMAFIIANVVIPLFRFGHDNIRYTAAHYVGLGTYVIQEENGGWLGAIIGIAIGGGALYGFILLGFNVMGPGLYANLVMLLSICAVAWFFLSKKITPCIEIGAYLKALRDNPDEITFSLRKSELEAKFKKDKIKKLTVYIAFILAIVLCFVIGYFANSATRNNVMKNAEISNSSVFEALDKQEIPYNEDDFLSIEYEVSELDALHQNCHASAQISNTRTGVAYTMTTNMDLYRYSRDEDWNVKNVECYYVINDIQLEGTWVGNASNVTTTSTSDDKITLTILECTKDGITAELTYVEKDGEVHEVLLTGTFRVMSQTRKAKMEGEHLIVEFTPDEKFSVFFEVYTKVKMEIDFLNNQIYWETCKATLLPQ